MGMLINKEERKNDRVFLLKTVTESALAEPDPRVVEVIGSDDED
jgi:hypothetical protein